MHWEPFKIITIFSHLSIFEKNNYSMKITLMQANNEAILADFAAAIEMKITLMQANNTIPNKKKIATIIWKDGTGGAERSIADLAVALDRDQFDMRFYYLSGGPEYFAKYIQQLGFKTEFLNWKNGHDINGRIRLIKSLKRYDPHLIHDHILPPLTRLFIKIFNKVPILYTEHGIACKHVFSPGTAKFRNLLRRADLFFCDLIAANSQASSTALQSVYNIPKSKIKIVHLGINLKELQPVIQTRSQLRIGYLGRMLQQHKGVDRLPLIAQFLLTNQHLDFKILVAGDGPDRAATEQACIALGVESQFQFLGWITDVKTFFAQIDVLVIPSHWEAFGLVALEALAMQVSVVAFNTGGLPEILKECPNGFLVHQDDVEGMAKAIISAKNTSQHTKDSGRKYIENFFSNHFMAKKIEGIYHQMIQGNF